MGNDKRPATGAGQQPLVVTAAVKRQVGRILAIPRIAERQTSRARVREMKDAASVGH